MKIIKIKEISETALSETDGKILRELILDSIDEIRQEGVKLDFEGVHLFATMYFNSSIGFLVLNESPDFVRNKIILSNLSSLGKNTYHYSYENAAHIRELRVEKF